MIPAQQFLKFQNQGQIRGPYSLEQYGSDQFSFLESGSQLCQNEQRLDTSLVAGNFSTPTITHFQFLIVFSQHLTSPD
jgi:hypothetical protein